MAKETARATKEKALTFRAFMARKTWKPFPSVLALTGDASFFKDQIAKRLLRELFGDSAPEVRRFRGAVERGAEELALATVLDELRTPSFFSPHRVAIVESANAFLAENGEAFIPFLDGGFSGGHLVALVDGKLDGRTKLAKALNQRGWVVDCPQPYDRPPPWDAQTPAWDSELTHWLVSHAREKGLEMAPPVAFLLHERAGTDLAVLAEEVEKLATYLASKGSQSVDEAAVTAVVGDLREDSVFEVVELFLEGRREEALDATRRLFSRGYHPGKGPVTTDPTAIALMFMGAMIPRLRALRRAHAMAQEGAGPNDWISAGLVHRPFISRFERHLAAVPPRKLVRLIDRLYEVDKGIKTGSDAEVLVELLVVEFGGKG